jgi:lipopolysaccharide exporter
MIYNKFKFLTQPGKRLYQRVVFAGVWMLTLRITVRGLGIVRIFVLARILTPDDYGLVAIALLIIEMANQLTATGFNTALIQKKGDIEGYLDIVWTMLVIRGLLLGILIFVTAPLVASLFDAPTATPIIQAMGTVLVLRGLVNSGVVYFDKELEIHKRFIWQMSSTIAEIIVSITTALILHNAWAIVFGAIVGSFIYVILSFFVHPYRPRLKYDYQKAKELFGFGIWVLFNAVALFVFLRADSIFVGRLLGVTALGLYTMAITIGRPIADEVGAIGDSVTFPVYSKLQDNHIKLCQAFSVSIEAVALISFPLAVTIFLLASDFVPLLLGNQWISAIPAMRIVVVSAAIYTLQSTGGQLLLAVGKPRLRFLMLLTTVFIMVALLVPLTKQFGLTGAATAVLVGNGGGLLFLTWALRTTLGLKIKDLARLLISPLFISLIMGITLVFIKYVVDQANLVGFIFILFIAALVYAASSFFLWKYFRTGPMQIIGVLRGRN